MLVVKIGGPAYRIGMGGGAASSVPSGSNSADLDFNAVQRGDAEMSNKLWRVVRSCVELGGGNPLVQIHDQVRACRRAVCVHASMHARASNLGARGSGGNLGRGGALTLLPLLPLLAAPAAAAAPAACCPCCLRLLRAPPRARAATATSSRRSSTRWAARSTCAPSRCGRRTAAAHSAQRRRTAAAHSGSVACTACSCRARLQLQSSRLPRAGQRACRAGAAAAAAAPAAQLGLPACLPIRSALLARCGAQRSLPRLAAPACAPQVGDKTMSVLEIWGAEYQENDCLLIKPGDRGLLQSICDRERCLMQVRARERKRERHGPRRCFAVWGVLVHAPRPAAAVRLERASVCGCAAPRRAVLCCWRLALMLSQSIHVRLPTGGSRCRAEFNQFRD